MEIPIPETAEALEETAEVRGEAEIPAVTVAVRLRICKAVKQWTE